jgi:diaminopimelate epimerase
MKLIFDKYQGTGNDFILIDNREKIFTGDHMTIAQLCERHFGIGADGVLLLEMVEGYDFRMVYYNSDGSPATMCGNGGRCIAAFANRLGIVDSKAHFLAADGPHDAEIGILDDHISQVALTMKDVIPASIGENHVFLNTGTPHFVRFVDEPDSIDLMKEGAQIRYAPDYAPTGTNVDFARREDERIYVRTYEKGVEAETLSCGTGVTASAIAASLFTGRNTYQVITRGGKLGVTFEKEGETFTNIRLSGPATCVYHGEINI